MATTPFKEAGSLNNTSVVTVVASPTTAQQKVVKSLIICNIDTASVNLTAYLYDGSANRYLVNNKSLATNEVIDLVPQGGVLVLDSTSDSIRVLLGGTVATNQPTFYASGAINS